AHRHVVVDAARKALDHAGAGHQLMARDLGVGRRLLERGNVETRCFHGGLLGNGRALGLRRYNRTNSKVSGVSPCWTGTATAPTSASSWSTAGTRSSGASGSGNIPGNFRKAESSAESR